VNDWLVDLSNTFGSNTFNYNVSNTNNASLGAKSPTSFYAGAHSFLQNTVNLDVSKNIDQFNIAFGENSDLNSIRLSLEMKLLTLSMIVTEI
jgi:iron complex outermembrane receptor protein